MSCGAWWMRGTATASRPCTLRLEWVRGRPWQLSWRPAPSAILPMSVAMMPGIVPAKRIRGLRSASISTAVSASTPSARTFSALGKLKRERQPIEARRKYTYTVAAPEKKKKRSEKTSHSANCPRYGASPAAAAPPSRSCAPPTASRRSPTRSCRKAATTRGRMRWWWRRQSARPTSRRCRRRI